MASALYKNRLVVCAADLNSDTLDWKPWASICWRDDGRRHLHLIRFSQDAFSAAADAETFALKTAQEWVDRQQLGPRMETAPGAAGASNKPATVIITHGTSRPGSPRSKIFRRGVETCYEIL